MASKSGNLAKPANVISVQEMENRSVPRSAERSVSPGVLLELQRSFFNLISQAEGAKIEKMEARRAYDEKVKKFEEARHALFDVAEFLMNHQAPGATPCDWMAVAQDRLAAVENQRR